MKCIHHGCEAKPLKWPFGLEWHKALGQSLWHDEVLTKSEYALALTLQCPECPRKPRKKDNTLVERTKQLYRPGQIAVGQHAHEEILKRQNCLTRPELFYKARVMPGVAERFKVWLAAGPFQCQAPASVPGSHQMLQKKEQEVLKVTATQSAANRESFLQVLLLRCWLRPCSINLYIPRKHCLCLFALCPHHSNSESPGCPKQGQRHSLPFVCLKQRSSLGES